MRRRGLLLAIALVLVTNAVVLLGVARNRSGAEATLALTEREANLTYAGREDTSLSLALRWQLETKWDERGWFDRETLAACGFDVSVPVDDVEDGDAPEHYSGRLARPAFVVFELEGDAWRRWRDAQERQHGERLEEMRAEERDESAIREAGEAFARRMASESRLFTVDAGRDAAALRARYPDRQRHAIVPSQVFINVRTRNDPDTGRLVERWLQGTVGGPLVRELHVGRGFRPVLEPFRDGRLPGVGVPLETVRGYSGPIWPEGSPRFAATVSWGTRGEPWIASIERLHADAPDAAPGVDAETGPLDAPVKETDR